MKNKKKLIAMLLVCVMSVTVALTGCSNGKNGDSASGDYVMDPVLNPLGSETICKEPVSIKIMMSQSGQVIDYDTNKFTLEIERKGNVDIKFDLLPAADKGTKINLALSSGTNLPDVINGGIDEANVATYGEAGTIIPLNIYYENSSEYLAPQIEALKEEKNLDLYDYIRGSDGNIYSVPVYHESLQNEIPQVLWINKTWLKKAGKDVPTTLDEFVEVLRIFKEKDMNGNGKKDELPIIDYASGPMLTLFENAFVKTGVDDITILDDGTLTFSYLTDEYKDYLKFVKGLYDEGLLDKTSFSQDSATLKTLVNGETTRVGVFTSTSTSILTAGTARRENHEYAPMFLDNSDKKDHSTFRYILTMPKSQYFITNVCEHPEVAFRIADYMCSEEMTVWSRWGEKDTDWLEPDGSTKGMYEFMGYEPYLVPVLQWGSPQNSHWQNAAPGFRRTNVSLGMASSDSSQESKAFAIKELTERYGMDFVDKAIPERIYKLTYTTEELDERAGLMNAIYSYVANSRFEFITGVKDIDRDWDAHIKELKTMNIDRLVEIINTAYERMNEN